MKYTPLSHCVAYLLTDLLRMSASTASMYFVQFGYDAENAVTDASGVPITVGIFDYELRGDGPSFNVGDMTPERIKANKDYYSVSTLLRDAIEDFNIDLDNEKKPFFFMAPALAALTPDQRRGVIEAFDTWLKRNREHPVPAPVTGADSFNYNSKHLELLRADVKASNLEDQSHIDVFYNAIGSHRAIQMTSKLMAEVFLNHLSREELIKIFRQPDVEPQTPEQQRATERSLARGDTVPPPETGLTL